MTLQTRPPFDPELATFLAAIGEQLPSTLTPDMIGPMRGAMIAPPIEEILAQRPAISHRQHRLAPEYPDPYPVEDAHQIERRQHLRGSVAGHRSHRPAPDVHRRRDS